MGASLPTAALSQPKKPDQAGSRAGMAIGQNDAGKQLTSRRHPARLGARQKRVLLGLVALESFFRKPSIFERIFRVITVFWGRGYFLKRNFGQRKFLRRPQNLLISSRDQAVLILEMNMPKAC